MSDVCTDGLILSHHFEDVDCEVGSPSGCSTNATKTLTLGTDASISTQTGANWPSDGTHSLAIGSTPTTIPITWDKTQGTISFDVYASTFAGPIDILWIGDLGGDFVKVLLAGSDDNNRVNFVIRYNWDPVYEVAADMGAFSGAKISVTAKWDVNMAHSGHYMALTIDAATTYYDSQPTAVDGTYTDLNMGVNNSSVCYIDNLKVYDYWLEIATGISLAVTETLSFSESLD